MPIEANEQAPAGIGSRQPHHHLHGLGAGGYKSNLVGTGYVLDDVLRQDHLIGCLQHAGCNDEQLVELLVQRLQILPVTVAPDPGTHADGEVDELSSVHVPQPLPQATFYEDRRLGTRTQIALAPWHHRQGPLREFSRHGGCGYGAFDRLIHDAAGLLSMVQTVSPTLTSPPAATAIERSTPSHGASISIVTFSLSMSYSASPFVKRWPGDLCHWLMVADSMFMPTRESLRLTFT
jgi:hypothetical protein